MEEALRKDLEDTIRAAVALHLKLGQEVFMDMPLKVVCMTLLMSINGIKKQSPEIWEMCENTFIDMDIISTEENGN